MNWKASFLFTVILFVANVSSANDAISVGCPTIAMSGTQVLCYGAATGSATVTVLSGSGNYTYTWSSVGAPGTNTITGLGVGTYTVNVKDNVSGCTVIGAYVVSQPDPISILSSFVTNVNCFGGSTGAIDVTPTGGKSPYTYSWSNGATSQDISGVPAGNYQLIITDANLCKDTSNFTVGQPIQALNSSAVITSVGCAGGMNGGVDVSVWGGSPPYAYSWDSGQNSQDVSGLVAGVYELTITDIKGCVRTETYNISQPLPLSISISSNNVSCFGSSTGSATVSVSGGTLPYNYSWQNSQTLFSNNSPTLSNIPADSYSVTVTDSKGCFISASTVVSQPTQLTATAAVTNVLCHGEFTGAIDLTVNGGSPTYSYAWTNGFGVPVSALQDLTALQAGTYNVVVTDQNGCTTNLSRVVTQPEAPLSSSFVVTNVLCHGNSTGSIDLTIEGGTSPYTYSWSSGQITQDVSFLPAGTYSFAVLDANSCPIGGSATVSQPAAPISVSAVVTNVLCFGQSNGQINLSPSGGTMPYTYTWENSVYELSFVSEDLSNIPAETYSYVLTDNNGCTFTGTETVTQPPVLSSSISGVNILCHGGNNGSVDLTVIGGTLPYSYDWTNSSTSQDLINLTAGTYAVVVTDGNGCTITNSITLTQPAAPLSLSFEKLDVKCNNGSDGMIWSFVNGGTTPYTYSWSNGGSTDMVSNLTAGEYFLDIVDFNGCTISDTIEILQPDAVTLNEVITPVSCYGLSDGDIDISPTGGTSPYSFTWFNSTFALSAQTEDLTDWPADIYQVEILDSNDCFYEMFFEITQPDSLVITFTTTAASCSGSSDADILVDITGGNPPYNTNWSNGETTEDLIGVPAGTYELVVVDTKGCTDSIEATIIEPLPVTMTFEVTEITCIDQKDGTALVTAAGGNGGYYYDWSHGETTAFVDSLDNQYYYVLVTDVLGCTGTDSVFIPKNEVVCVDPVNTFTPNGDNYNDTWVIDNMHLYPNAELQIFNKWGNLIHNQTGVYEPWNGLTNNVPAPSDQYYYILNLNYLDREPIIGNINIVR
jgi:gliding motility-associated-like protein